MENFATVDLRNRNGVEILFKALKVSKKITDNPHFPNPTPDLGSFNTAINNLKQALGAYDGSKLTLARRKSAEHEMSKQYRKMATYVNNIANGDAEIILSSGYDLNRKKTRIYVTEAPVMRRYIKSFAEGQIKIRWIKVPKAIRYSIYLYAADQPDVVLGTYHSYKTSFILKGLESGKKYVVRVQARCRRNEGPLSIGQMIYEVW